MNTIDVLDKDDVQDLIRGEGASVESIDEIWKSIDALRKRIDDHTSIGHHSCICGPEK